MASKVKSNGIKQEKWPGIVVFPMSHGVFDVFQDGWKVYSRYRRFKGRYIHLGGAVLPADLLENLVVSHG